MSVALATDMGEVPPVVDPYLYILMRTDLTSLNPGKAIAQGCHAANQFVHQFGGGNGKPAVSGFDLWKSEASLMPLVRQQGKGPDAAQGVMIYTPAGFGTTICLGVVERELRTVVDLALRLGHAAGITHDPSYPIRDGQITHLIPLDTCGFVFGSKGELNLLLKNFPLHP